MVAPYAFSPEGSPKMPVGRTRSTRIRIEKATASRIGVEIYPMVNASAWPMINAPTKAPGMLPMPPKTAATKAFKPGRMPN